jgi:hypothetical protein
VQAAGGLDEQGVGVCGGAGSPPDRGQVCQRSASHTRSVSDPSAWAVTPVSAARMVVMRITHQPAGVDDVGRGRSGIELAGDPAAVKLLLRQPIRAAGGDHHPTGGGDHRSPCRRSRRCSRVSSWIVLRCSRRSSWRCGGRPTCPCASGSQGRWTPRSPRRTASSGRARDR